MNVLRLSAFAGATALLLSGCSSQSAAYEPIHNSCVTMLGVELEWGPAQGEELHEQIMPELIVANAASPEETGPFLPVLEKFDQLNKDKAAYWVAQEPFLMIIYTSGNLMTEEEARIQIDERKAKTLVDGPDSTEIEREFAVRGQFVLDSFATLCEEYLAPPA